MSERQVTEPVKKAVARLFPEDLEYVLNLLLDASGSERVHRDVLVLSFGDRDRLEQFAATAKSEPYDVFLCEERPEEFLDISNRPKAAAELTRRFEALGFEVPHHTAYWAQFAEPGAAPDTSRR
jgi:hypothetical protein